MLPIFSACLFHTSTQRRVLLTVPRILDMRALPGFMLVLLMSLFAVSQVTTIFAFVRYPSPLATSS